MAHCPSFLHGSWIMFSSHAFPWRIILQTMPRGQAGGRWHGWAGGAAGRLRRHGLRGILDLSMWHVEAVCPQPTPVDSAGREGTGGVCVLHGA